MEQNMNQALLQY